MKNILFTAILLFTQQSIANDYATQVNAKLIDRLDRLERDLNVMQKQFYKTGSTSSNKFSRSSNIPQESGNSEIESRVLLIEEQMRDLNGRIEEAQFVSKQVLEKLDQINKDIDFRLSQMEKSGNIKTDKDGIEQITDSINDEKLDIDKSKKEVPTDFSKSTPLNEQIKKPDNKGNIKTKEIEEPLDKKEMETSQRKAQYEAIIEKIKANNLDEAQNKLEEFISKNGDDPLVGNAYYWLGEVHFSKKQYEKAAIKYLKGYKQFAKGKRAPDSLYKLSVSLGNLKKINEACNTLDKLFDRFPDMQTNIRNGAQKQYKQLGCKKS